MGWIEDKSIWIFLPAFADELVYGETPKSLEPPGVGRVVGVGQTQQRGIARVCNASQSVVLIETACLGFLASREAEYSLESFGRISKNLLKNY